MTESFWQKKERREQERQAWLDGLVPGDTVAIARYSRFGGGREFFEAIVLRRTKTLIITEGRYAREERFRADSGQEQGSRYGGMELVPMTDAIRAEMRAAKNRERFAKIINRNRELDDEQIAAMLEAYDRVTDREKAV